MDLHTLTLEERRTIYTKVLRKYQYDHRTKVGICTRLVITYLNMFNPDHRPNDLSILFPEFIKYKPKIGDNVYSPKGEIFTLTEDNLQLLNDMYWFPDNVRRIEVLEEILTNLK